MSNPRRKQRWRNKRAASNLVENHATQALRGASNPVTKQEVAAVGGYPAGDKRVADLGPVPPSLRSPHAFPSYAGCHPLDWVPDYENAHLLSAAAGRLTIGDPFHHAPAPIDFAPPGRARC